MKKFHKKIKIFFLMAALFCIPAVAYAIKLIDPLGAESPVEIFARVIQGTLGAVGVWTLLNFTIAGFGIITSGGNPQKLEKNKENLKWTTIGLLLLFGSYVAVSYLLDHLGNVGGS
jgi:hypothetical protein